MTDWQPLINALAGMLVALTVAMTAYNAYKATQTHTLVNSAHALLTADNLAKQTKIDNLEAIIGSHQPPGPPTP